MHASERELHANLPKLEGKINMKNEVRGNPNISCGKNILNIQPGPHFIFRLFKVDDVVLTLAGPLS